MTVRSKQCHFSSDEVNHLGHIFTSRKLHVVVKKKDAFKTLKYPMTKTGLLSFLGLCNDYRRFMQSFAKNAATFK